MFTTISTYYTFPKTIKIHVKYISNKKFMQTIFKVSIQPAAGYLVKLSLPLQNQIIWDIYGPTTGLIWFNLWAIYGRYMALVWPGCLHSIPISCF